MLHHLEEDIKVIYDRAWDPTGASLGIFTIMISCNYVVRIHMPIRREEIQPELTNDRSE